MVSDPQNAAQPASAVDRIKLASWQGSKIVKAADGLFRVANGGVLPTDDEAKVRSGALEQSNVDPTSILVQMVEAQRLFEMRTKLVASAKELDESGASLMRLT
jgi:flagellar basal-body rod protein FlgF